LEAGFKESQSAVSNILGNMQRLVNGKRASREMFNDSEALLLASEKLNDSYETELAGRRVNFVLLTVVSVLALFILLLMGKVYLDDSRRRAEESERQNRANQEAILRLLDEMGNLASGHLCADRNVTAREIAHLVQQTQNGFLVGAGLPISAVHTCQLPSP